MTIRTLVTTTFHFKDLKLSLSSLRSSLQVSRNSFNKTLFIIFTHCVRDINDWLADSYWLADDCFESWLVNDCLQSQLANDCLESWLANDCFESWLANLVVEIDDEVMVYCWDCEYIFWDNDQCCVLMIEIVCEFANVLIKVTSFSSIYWRFWFWVFFILAHWESDIEIEIEREIFDNGVFIILKDRSYDSKSVLTNILYIPSIWGLDRWIY